MKQWHYTLAGKPQPAVTEETLKTLISQGKLPRYEFVWAEGMEKWQPAAKFFDLEFTLQENPDFNLLSCWVVWAVCLAMIITPKMMAVKLLMAKLPILTLFMPLITSLGLLVLMIYTPITLRKTYVFGKIATAKGRPALGRSMRVLALTLTTIFWVGFVSVGILSSVITNRALQIQKAGAGVPKSNAVVMTDAIVHKDAQDLQAILKRNPKIKSLYIKSTQGNMRAALDIAKLVQQYHLDVYTMGKCAGACPVILMAADKRYAEWNMTISIIAQKTWAGGMVPIDGTPELTPQEQQEVTALFAKRGMPEMIVNHDFNGSGMFYNALALNMAQAHMLTGLTNKGKYISVEDALELAKPSPLISKPE